MTARNNFSKFYYSRSLIRSNKLNSEINVTPFVDVMLVLLVIFMVTSPMLISGVEVNLPKITKSLPLHANDEPLVLSIDKQGNIYVQDTKIAMRYLKPKLHSILKANKDTKIFVKGDQRVDYGKVMNLFTTVKETGFTKVALVTELEQN